MNSFSITSSTTELVAAKLRKSNIIQDILNKNLVLKQYTDKIQEIFFIYQAFEPDNKYVNFKNNVVFRRNTNVLELYLNLDYESIVQADNDHVLQLLAEGYLKGIDLFLSNRKDIDAKRLYKDVQQLFIQQQLIRTVNQLVS